MARQKLVRAEGANSFCVRFRPCGRRDWDL